MCFTYACKRFFSFKKVCIKCLEITGVCCRIDTALMSKVTHLTGSRNTNTMFQSEILKLPVRR